MATDNVKALLYSKKILPLDVFKTGLLDFLRDEIKRVLQFDYSLGAILSPTALPVVATGNNMINVGATGGPWKTTTGTGYLINFNAGDARLQNIAIPPDAGTVYSVALESCEVESSVEQNPRTSEYQYRYILETIGRKAAPDAVVLAGANVTLTVDAVTEAGHSYAGRSVRVWLKSKADGGPGPQTLLDASAILTGVVTYVGGHNVVTVAAMGQTTPSTNPADYWVQLVGPTVRRKAVEDLSTTVGAVFLGEVTAVAAGAPITTITTTAQRLVGFTLADTAEVFRRDAHGHVKVRVQADATDAAESQLAVDDHGGVRRFTVDETGAVLAASAHVTGAATIDGVLTAASEHVTGNATVDGALSAGSAAITGGVSAASAAVAGTMTAGSVAATAAVTGATAHITGASALDGDLTLGTTLAFGAANVGAGGAYAANRMSRLQIPRAWGQIRPDGTTTNGHFQPLTDGYNVQTPYNSGNFIYVPFVNAMDDANFVVTLSWDDWYFGGSTDGRFGGTFVPFVSDQFGFNIRARQLNSDTSWTSIIAGSASGVHLFFAVYGRQ
jgi:hypothetical protein